MSNEQRIENIILFLAGERYLANTSYTVEAETEDSFVILFKSASERQLATLRRALIQAELTNIRPVAEEIIKYEPNKFKRNGRKRTERNNRP